MLKGVNLTTKKLYAINLTKEKKKERAMSSVTFGEKTVR